MHKEQKHTNTPFVECWLDAFTDLWEMYEERVHCSSKEDANGSSTINSEEEQLILDMSEAGGAHMAERSASNMHFVSNTSFCVFTEADGEEFLFRSLNL